MERHGNYITWKGTVPPQGRVPTEAESVARRRRRGPSGRIPQPVWTEARNGMPPLRPYVWRARRAQGGSGQ
jgi:hypothetical protein